MSENQNPLQRYVPPPAPEAKGGDKPYVRKRRTERDPLSPREAYFVAKICEGVEPTEAARLAHYRDTTPAAARALLEQPHVQAAIADHMGAQASVAAVTLQRLISEHAAIALSDIADVIGLTPGEIADLPPEVTAAIKSVEETRNGIKITMHDKHRSLDALAKIADLYRTPEEEAVLTTFGAMLREAQRRANGD